MLKIRIYIICDTMWSLGMFFHHINGLQMALVPAILRLIHAYQNPFHDKAINHYAEFEIWIK